MTQTVNKLMNTLETSTSELDDLSQSNRGRAGVWPWLRDLVETLVLALVIFLVVNTFTGRY